MPIENAWAELWARMTDEALESAARDYLWLAVASPGLLDKRRSEIIAEAERRGKPDIIDRAKIKLKPPARRGKKGASGRR